MSTYQKRVLDDQSIMKAPAIVIAYANKNATICGPNEFVVPKIKTNIVSMMIAKMGSAIDVGLH